MGCPLTFEPELNASGVRPFVTSPPSFSLEIIAHLSSHTKRRRAIDEEELSVLNSFTPPLASLEQDRIKEGENSSMLESSHGYLQLLAQTVLPMWLYQ
ncbi:hypothetical protein CSUI_006446 [Cystoisospora suis]|uniref:Uncharacterized protein n=1 Tax=Cystoisospora suis TaxID=483139 RepID=A0A2C6KUC7_9APIC|nr:hypothetical protein CSUI_006446 [Cystoisospora suis]